mgnify:FL=1
MILQSVFVENSWSAVISLAQDSSDVLAQVERNEKLVFQLEFLAGCLEESDSIIFAVVANVGTQEHY